MFRNEEITGLLTVRTKSSRLPNKCLLKLGESTVLEHDIARAKYFGIRVIICTTEEESDDVLETLAEKNKTLIFRGSTENKLKRWLDCADHFNLEDFHTIDADDPFLDFNLVKKSMEKLRENQLEVVYPSKRSDQGAATVGYSFDVNSLRKIVNQIEINQDTEMINPWITDNLVNVARIDEDFQHQNEIRLTLDYYEDYLLIQVLHKLIGSFENRRAIDEIFVRNPDLFRINSNMSEVWKSRQRSLEEKNKPSTNGEVR
jgi:spore coat polysaccharide biosynthesis protein SpsF (cytidylyltransferase family)